jgi:hypothetical protein
VVVGENKIKAISKKKHTGGPNDAFRHVIWAFFLACFSCYVVVVVGGLDVGIGLDIGRGRGLENGGGCRLKSGGGGLEMCCRTGNGGGGALWWWVKKENKGC